MKNDPFILKTYPDIYRELIYQRNELIRWLEENNLLERQRVIKQGAGEEWVRHQVAKLHRESFRESILEILNQLYSHDAMEAVYDFNSAELGDWTDTDANWLERELQQLQKIISKLETRYDLSYRAIFEYDSDAGALYLNRKEVMSVGLGTQKHHILTMLFSNPKKLWDFDDIETYFQKQGWANFGELKERNIEKAGNDIKTKVAENTGVDDFLVVSRHALRINQANLGN